MFITKACQIVAIITTFILDSGLLTRTQLVSGQSVLYPKASLVLFPTLPQEQLWTNHRLLNSHFLL